MACPRQASGEDTYQWRVLGMPLARLTSACLMDATNDENITPPLGFFLLVKMETRGEMLEKRLRS